jgi:hypothetical protein
MLTLLALILPLCMLLIPTRLLRAWARSILRGRFCRDAEEVLFFLSGRSGLCEVLGRLQAASGGGAVLVPDYVCNLVHKAVASCGLSPRVYATDEAFRPNLEQIEDALARGDAVAVLLASILGAQSSGPQIVRRIRRADPDVVILLDECQNLVPDSPARLDDRCVVLVSFNMKNVNGAMGGAVCLRRNFLGLAEPRLALPARMRQDLCMVLFHVASMGRLCLEQLRAWMCLPPPPTGSRARGPYRWPALEYSQCDRLPYELIARPIARISLADAILGMLLMPAVLRRRRANARIFLRFLAQTHLGRPIRTERAATGPFLPFEAHDTRLFGWLPLKGPYARPDDENASLRPELCCLRNTGLGPLRPPSLPGVGEPAQPAAPSTPG